MKKYSILLTLALFAFVSLSTAQTKTDDQPTVTQSIEVDSLHNLSVAWQYFKSKKAYQSSLMRTDETLVANPAFSKIDEVLYIAGMSCYYLLNNKGKQKLNFALMSDAEKERFSSDRLREDAYVYLGMLIEDHADSKYAKKAKKYFDELDKSRKKSD
ncbi:MAG: hypothetical protein ACK5NT_15120 [Pyrinomonadaceae bacterium]